MNGVHLLLCPCVLSEEAQVDGVHILLFLCVFSEEAQVNGVHILLFLRSRVERRGPGGRCSLRLRLEGFWLESRQNLVSFHGTEVSWNGSGL